MRMILAHSILIVVGLTVGCDEQPSTYAPDPNYERQVKETDRQLEQASDQLDKTSRQLERSAMQSERLDQLLDRWEQQADRYDALLDRWEKQPVPGGG